MASLFPDDQTAGGRPLPRKGPARLKAAQTDLPPLPADWILAHCDGGARGNPGPAGFGAVVVDAGGCPLAELSEFLGFRTNNYAEYSGLLAVLAWALENGHRKLRVISDSLLMVRQMQGKYKVNSPDLRPLYEEARRRSAQLAGFEIHHALRHKNKVADQLANAAMDRGMGKPAGGREGARLATATPYPQRASAPPVPQSFALPASERGTTMGLGAKELGAGEEGPGATTLRGFVRDGVVHLLGGKPLPENSFVKIVPE